MDNIDLPIDDEAEKLLIACLIVDSRRYFDICKTISTADFWHPIHKAVYAAIESLMQSASIDSTPRNGRALLDVKAIQDRLVKDKKGVRLADYAEAIGTGWDYKYYASRVADVARRRAVVMASQDIRHQAMETTDPTQELIDGVMKRAAELQVGQGSGSRLRSIGDVIRDELIPKIEQHLYGTAQDDALIGTGWNCIDKILGRLHRGALITVAGRPGQGKTTFASNVAAHVALQEKKHVLFVTLEQPQREIAESVWRSIAGVGGLIGLDSREEKQSRFNKMLGVVGQLNTDRLMLYESSGVTVEEIAAVARMQAVKDLSLIVIDYLGQIKKPRDIHPVAYQIEHITSNLKGLAKQLRVPILLLCQMSRAFDKDSEEEPQLHHLRDSGAIEQDSDVVVFVWRPKDGEQTHIKVAKNRHGVIGRTELEFLGDCKLFTEPTPSRFDAFDDYNNRREDDTF